MGYDRLNLKTGDKLTEDGFKHIEDGIASAASTADGAAPKDHTHAWADITGKPTIPAAATADNLSGATDTGRKVLKAADAAAARSAIGAGTGSSNLALGTTATTAAKGDHVHAYADLTGKPTIPSISGLAKQSDLDAALARIKALEDANTTPAEG